MHDAGRAAVATRLHDKALGSKLSARLTPEPLYGRFFHGEQFFRTGHFSPDRVGAVVGDCALREHGLQGAVLACASVERIEDVWRLAQEFLHRQVFGLEEFAHVLRGREAQVQARALLEHREAFLGLCICGAILAYFLDGMVERELVRKPPDTAVGIEKERMRLIYCGRTQLEPPVGSAHERSLPLRCRAAEKYRYPLAFLYPEGFFFREGNSAPLARMFENVS